MRRFLRAQNLSAPSLRDVLEARDHYSVHLANLPNVLGTAVGRYRVRVKDKRTPREIIRGGSSSLGAKTLTNSAIREWSWPCVLVFVDEWLAPDVFAKHPEKAVPPLLYMPDGRIVRTCVVLVEPRKKNLPSESLLLNPAHVLGSGSQIFTQAQGQVRLGAATCLVTDGGLTYTLASGHVLSPLGSDIQGPTRTGVRTLGTSAKIVGSVPMTELYPGYPGARTQVTLDAGLVQVESAHDWTSQIAGVGAMGVPVDLSAETLNLDLVGAPLFTVLPGGHRVEGSVHGLFYRHASMSGIDQVTEFLIGPRDGGQVETRPGDSGVLWFWDHLNDPLGDEDEMPAPEVRSTEFRPVAVQWGGHGFLTESPTGTEFALASGLSSICRYLGVEVVRDWGAFGSRYWGKVGHYKIAATACTLLQSPKARKLFKANLSRIGVEDEAIENGDLPGMKDAATFIALADVADLYFRTHRKKDDANHFADMDEVSPQGTYKGKTLLQLWNKNPSSRTPAAWTEFYDSFEPPKRMDKHRGALPFRIKQLYELMVASVAAGNMAEYICAAGLLAHYAGDACQPLHVSHLHHGEVDDDTDDDVHKVYEDSMLTSYRVAVIEGVNAIAERVAASELFTGGDAAADAVVQLMGRTVKALPPEKVLDVFNDTRGPGQTKKMWERLKTPTIKRLADGAHTLALIWQSAWKEGNGEAKVAVTKLKAIPQPTLKALYESPNFAKSDWLRNM